MINYAKASPVDEFGNPLHNSPPNVPALASTARENASTSSTTALNANTTVVGVTAVGTGAGIKWGNSVIGVAISAAAANFDNYIPAGTTMMLVVPRTRQGATASVVGKGVINGLANNIATITSGVGSVLLAEY